MGRQWGLQWRGYSVWHSKKKNDYLQGVVPDVDDTVGGCQDIAMADDHSAAEELLPVVSRYEQTHNLMTLWL